MKKHYLCSRHRTLMARNTSTAIHCFMKSLNTGCKHVRSGCPDQALPFLFSAFEIAEILLQKEMIERRYIGFYVAASKTLAETLLKRRRQTHSASVYQHAIDQLGELLVQQEVFEEDCAAAMATLKERAEGLNKAVDTTSSAKAIPISTTIKARLH